MWRRTLARLRNMPRWESSPVDVQCAHTKRVTPSRPVPDPAGPAAAEPVTGTGFDNMITDATAASSSVLVTDSCMRATCPVFLVCTRKSALYAGLNTSHAESTVAKTLRPLLFCSRAPFEMPKNKNEKAPAVRSRGGQLVLAEKMAGRVKDARESVKGKAVAADKGKGGRRAPETSDDSELEGSQSDNSSTVSSLVDIVTSQKPMPTEGEAAPRRPKPEKPEIEVTFHFSIFVHSHVLI